MITNVSVSNGVKCIAVAGPVLSNQAADFADFVDNVLADGNLSIYWKLSELDPSIDGPGAAIFVEAFARLRAADIGLVLLHPPSTLKSFLIKAGMEASIFMVDSERDALVAVFSRFEKKYDDSFFQLLIKEGCITRQQLAKAHLEFDLRDGKVPIDELMLEMELITVEDIMRATAHRKSFLGEILVDTGLITPETLESVLEIQKTSGGKLGDLLKKVGAITDRDIYEALAIQYWRKMELNEDDHRIVNEVDLLGFLSSNDYLIIHDAEERLIEMGGDVVPFLIEKLQTKEHSVQASILKVLGEIRDSRSVVAIYEFLASPDNLLKDEAYWALVKMSGKDLSSTASWRWGRWVKSFLNSEPKVQPFTPFDDEEVSETLHKIAKGKMGIGSVSFEFETGRVNWEGGKVNLLITGDGKVFVKRNCRGNISLFSRMISIERVKDLVSNLENQNILSIKTSRSFGTVDEPRNSYTFRIGPKLRKKVFYWATEMYASLELMNIENITRMLLNFIEL
jgi:hypothetical protein